MWPIQLVFLACKIFLSSSTPLILPFLIRSVQLIFSTLPQQHILKISTYFWPTYWSVQVSAPYKTMLKILYLKLNQVQLKHHMRCSLCRCIFFLCAWNYIITSLAWRPLKFTMERFFNSFDKLCHPFPFCVCSLMKNFVNKITSVL